MKSVSASPPPVGKTSFFPTTKIVNKSKFCNQNAFNNNLEDDDSQVGSSSRMNSVEIT